MGRTRLASHEITDRIANLRSVNWGSQLTWVSENEVRIRHTGLTTADVSAHRCGPISGVFAVTRLCREAAFAVPFQITSFSDHWARKNGLL